MEIESGTIMQLFNQLGQEEYRLIGIVTLFILVLSYLYVLFRKQKRQQIIAENKVQMFQKTFDMSQDPTLILSD
ncbi:MAG: hypothetical protein KJO45_03215, partial [Sulfurovum sp.]|nr:hypothetical protein [Sulfurovum sp.]